jgi:polyferredoxin
MGREVEDGMIENVYRLQVMNTGETAHEFRVEVEGMASARIVDGEAIAVDAASSRAVPVRVRVAPGRGERGSNEIQFKVTATDDPALTVTEGAAFIVPR